MTFLQRINWLWVIGVSLLSALFPYGANAQSSLPTFTCDGYPYQVLSGELKKLDPISLTYTSQGPTTSPGMNGIGYNILDNYAYGMSGSNVFRLGSNGTREKVSTGIAGATNFVADMNLMGDLFSLRKSNRKKIVVIDIPASIAAPSGNTVTSELTFTGPTPPGTGDITWIEDSGTEYLLLIKNNKVYYYNLSTLTITSKTLTLPSGITKINFGAAWSDQVNRVWGFNNKTGEIFELIDTFTASPELILVATTDPNNNNDGFSCAQASFPSLPPVAQDDDFTTLVGTSITENVISDNGNGVDSDPDGAALSILWSDPGTTAPANGALSATGTNGDFTYTPNPGFYGTDSFEYVLTDGSATDIGLVTLSIPVDNGDAPGVYGDALHNISNTLTLGAAVTLDAASQASVDADADTDDSLTLPDFVQGATTTLSVNFVQATANEGYLQAWIDWNGNDDFTDTGDQIALDMQSAIAGPGSITISIPVPADATTDQTYLRLRWSSLSGLNSVVTAPDGEVEDYAITVLTPALLDANKTVSLWDPMNTGLYALPGNDVIYTIEGQNTGGGPADADSIILIDHIPPDITFYNGDIDDGGPQSNAVKFEQSAGAGLSFNYASDVKYSNSASKPAGFSNCTYTPAPGYDPNVTFICFNPKGAFAGGDPAPTFSVSFRSRIN